MRLAILTRHLPIQFSHESLRRLCMMYERLSQTAWLGYCITPNRFPKQPSKLEKPTKYEHDAGKDGVKLTGSINQIVEAEGQLSGMERRSKGEMTRRLPAVAEVGRVDAKSSCEPVRFPGTVSEWKVTWEALSRNRPSLATLLESLFQCFNAAHPPLDTSLYL